ncbi:MAG: hypothetical protein EPO55_14215 [Reyranella sp.]|uniref:hypothetical protein n=1 Tax=Reyranella sp. TaxID=1929291 RepID=UPI00121A3889|nr:hypothetical protein [Reyranella sp.]TAJ38927.1 MAG: hypothetical protein EPO55_14215 [Reyranella sp.]
MATTIYPTVPVARPEAEAWPPNDIGDDDPIGIQADEMFARQLDTGFAGEIRVLVHDPETGLAGKGPEDALSGIAEAMPMLGELKDRYLAQAIGPRQRAILEPLIDTRLDRATGDLGRLAQQATSALDDRIVAERLAGFHQDAALAWHDPAQLRVLGQAAVGELRYQGERKGWDATQTDTTVRQGLSDLYAGAIEQAIGQDPDGAANLYEHARDVIQPERQVAIDRRFVEASEDKAVARIGDDLRTGWARMSIAPSTADVPDLESTARPRPDIRWFLDQATTQLDDNSSPRLRGLVQSEAFAQFFRAGKEWLAGRSQAVADVLKWQTENPTALFTDIPSGLRSKMSPDQMAAFRLFASVQGHIEPDLGLYDRLERELIDRPASFASIKLDEYVLDLGAESTHRLVDLQNEIRNGDPAGHVAFARASRRLVEDAVVSAGFEADAALGQIVREKVRHRVADFPKLNGRVPTENDLVRIVDEEAQHLGAEGQKRQPENASPSGVEIAQAKSEQAPAPLDAPPPRAAGDPVLPNSINDLPAPPQMLDPIRPKKNPELNRPDRSKYHLKFDGRYLKLYHGEDVIEEWPAVSGKENFGSAKDQNKVGYGPIPEGAYDIKMSRFQSIDLKGALYGTAKIADVDAGKWPGSLCSWGSERVWADPTKETEDSGLTFGRKDMAIHGGWSRGSAGCIDLTGSMSRFSRAFWDLGIDLKLYVDYSPPVP